VLYEEVEADQQGRTAAAGRPRIIDIHSGSEGTALEVRKFGRECEGRENRAPGTGHQVRTEALEGCRSLGPRPSTPASRSAGVRGIASNS